jgi:thioredoxin-like negative regulator of GroEL
MLYASGQLDESLAEARRALELNPGEQDHAVDISRNLILLERYEEALTSIALLPPGKDSDYVIALLHRAPGRRAEADAALERLAAGTLDTIDVVHLAEVQTFRGRTDEAFNVLLDYEEQLERNRKQNPREPWNLQDEIRMSWLLKPLHADPRWANLTEQPAVS